MQQIVDLLQPGIDRQPDIGHDVVPRNRAGIVGVEHLARADLAAEHHVADAGVPIVHRFVQRTDTEHDVVVHRPVAAGAQLTDVVVEARLAHLVAHALGVDVLVVEVEHHLVLAPLQHVFQTGNAIRRQFAVAIDQPESLQLLVGVVGHAPLAVGRAVDRQVVHEHHHAVLREAEIDLEKGRHHRQGFLARLDAVFGIAGHHAAAMAADDNVPLGVVAEIGFEVFKTIDLNGVKPFLRRGTLLRDGGK